MSYSIYAVGFSLLQDYQTDNDLMVGLGGRLDVVDVVVLQMVTVPMALMEPTESKIGNDEQCLIWTYSIKTSITFKIYWKR